MNFQNLIEFVERYLKHNVKKIKLKILFYKATGLNEYMQQNGKQ